MPAAIPAGDHLRPSVGYRKGESDQAFRNEKRVRLVAARTLVLRSDIAAGAFFYPFGQLRQASALAFCLAGAPAEDDLVRIECHSALDLSLIHI